MSDIKLVYAALWIVGVKLAGYCGAAAVLKDWYGNRAASTLQIGTFRTVLGWLGGALAISFSNAIDGGLTNIILSVVICRLLEWIVVFLIYFERPTWRTKRGVPRLFAAVLWSCLLDLPVLLGVLPMIGKFVC